MKRCLVLLLALSLGTSAYATTCDGSADPCDSPSATYADVSAAVLLTPRNGTLRVPADSQNWGTSTLTLTKGIKLIGAGRDNTSITSGLTGERPPAECIIDLQPDATTRDNHDEIRVEGFTFDGGTWQIAVNNKPNYFNMVIGWNRFKNNGKTVIATGGFTIGTIYQNEFDCVGIVLQAGGADTIGEHIDYPTGFGTNYNLFFESNYVHFSRVFIQNGTGWIETFQSGRAVVRYNTFDYTNASESETLDVHGFQGFNSPRGSNSFGQTGTVIAEMYGNTITGVAGIRSINHRGGPGLFFNNIITATSSPVIHASQYGDPATDSGGSGCQSDVEATCGTNPDCQGRTVAGNVLTQINNTYTFNNTVNTVVVNMTLDTVLPDHCGIADGTDFYNYNASFGNGENGIGRGTSNPSTTGNPDGAAFWVASTAMPTVDPAVIQAGHLWKRVGGVWINYYHSYTYPHPLAGPAPGVGPTPTPSPRPAGGFFFAKK